MSIVILKDIILPEELVREVHQYYAPTSCYIVPKIIKQS